MLENGENGGNCGFGDRTGEGFSNKGGVGDGKGLVGGGALSTTVVVDNE